MSKSLDKIEKDSASDESSDSKTAKSDSPVSQTNKERRKSVKKKMLRSGNRRPRLSGGADEAAASASATTTPDQRVQIKEEVQSHNDTVTESRSQPDTPPSSPVGCPKDTLAKTGDAKADEILECALKNLEEAGKALACLGQNLEHELKLALVDIMNRMRKWSSSVESKMEWTRRDVIELSKELASRIQTLQETIREADELREQLSNGDGLTQKSLTSLSRKTDAASMRMGPGGTQDGRSIHGAGGGVDPSDPCGEPISPCDQPPFVREGDTDINAYKAEQERLMACCAELEEEICCLKKENERIVKERAEYENAIQRALLKGVSSLNVEALKVLRCTPIPSCCPPCAPTSSIEPVSKSRDCTSPRSQQRDPCGGGNNNNGRNGGSKSCNSSREGLHSRGGNGGRVCPSTGHSERKSKKSRDNNMLLLLHQKDAENFGIQGGCDSGQKKSNDCGKHKKSNYQC